MHLKVTRAFPAALAAALFATGCSGGGGGGGGGNGGDPPVADAGDDGQARLYQSYALDGSQSLDPEDKPLSFTWSILSAPDGSAATLTSGGAAASVAFTPDTDGIYLFGLVVSDGKKISTLDTVEVTVELRIAVFADYYGELARELEVYGAGQADDYYAWPDSYLADAAGEIAVFVDERDRRESLIAYRATNGTQEQLVTGEEISNVLVGGDHVVWRERRGGQMDLFTRDLVTGEEIQITSDEEFEDVGTIAPEFVTFTKPNAPYGNDLFLYDFASHGLTNLSDMDAGDELASWTDGDTIIYTSFAGNADVYMYDPSTQVTTPLGDTAANEYAYGVAGDFAILGVSTSASTTLYRHQISTGNRTAIGATFDGIYGTQGDYFVYSIGSTLRAYRLSTNTATDVVTSFASFGGTASLHNGVLAWTDYNPGTSTFDVKYRTLPSGAISTIAGTGNATGRVEALDSGIAWDAHDGDYIYDVFYSADGGVTTDLASDSKIYLADRLADYDVVVVGNDVDSSFQTDTLDAILAAGIPILSFDRNYNALGSHIEDDYGLVMDGGDCGATAIRFSNSAHPAFAGFPSGTWTMLDDLDIDADRHAAYIDPDEMDLPADFVSLATYDVSSDCVYEGESAIVTFTTDDGSAVILDAAGDTYLPLWTVSRRDLVISELRYLASTRAP